MALQINKNLYPKSGYFFKDSDGLTIRADSWAGLFKRVENYRRRANLPIGNVQQEVVSQVCSRNPGICNEENPTYTAELKKSNLKGRVLAWMSGKVRDKEKQLSFEHEAKARAAICAGCPRNQALPDGCASCRQAVQESRKQIIGARFQDGRLNFCSVLGEDLNSSMWLEQIREGNPELPANCWRKREIQ